MAWGGGADAKTVMRNKSRVLPLRLCFVLSSILVVYFLMIHMFVVNVERSKLFSAMHRNIKFE